MFTVFYAEDSLISILFIQQQLGWWQVCVCWRHIEVKSKWNKLKFNFNNENEKKTFNWAFQTICEKIKGQN